MAIDITAFVSRWRMPLMLLLLIVIVLVIVQIEFGWLGFFSATAALFGVLSVGFRVYQIWSINRDRKVRR